MAFGGSEEQDEEPATGAAEPSQRPVGSPPPPVAGTETAREPVTRGAGGTIRLIERDPEFSAPAEPAPRAAAAAPVEAGTPPVEPAASPSARAMSVYADLSEERPELLVAGAFAGAFLVAKILRRLGGG